MKIDRRTYAAHYGPTTGDRVRLGDTDLIIEVEGDHTSFGDECKFGGGKVIRDGMGQSPEATRGGGAPDLVITNALVLDYTGIYKADIGVRDGRISAIGKAGNPGTSKKDSTGLALYNLSLDPGERYNVKDFNPDIVKQLEMVADKAREDLGDDLSGNKGKNRREPGRIQ